MSPVGFSQQRDESRLLAQTHRIAAGFPTFELFLLKPRRPRARNSAARRREIETRASEVEDMWATELLMVPVLITGSEEPVQRVYCLSR